jgi:hypothetical protein
MKEFVQGPTVGKRDFTQVLTESQAHVLCGTLPEDDVGSSVTYR